MKFEVWNKETYSDFVEYLKGIQDIEYRDFNSKLIPNINKETIIGIRIPELRKIAKKITKADYQEFLKISQNNYFEETLIQGLVIANIKDKEIFDKQFKQYIKKIDNWATCDTFCNSIKIIETNKDYYFEYFSNYLKSKKEYEIRCILVIYLNHYVEEKYIDKIFKNIDEITSKDYYVQMAIAWLLSVIYVKFKENLITYIKNSKLDKFTFNKTIQKIIESNRVSKTEKEILRKLKIK